jgi:hypothetical protein
VQTLHSAVALSQGQRLHCKYFASIRKITWRAIDYF